MSRGMNSHQLQTRFDNFAVGIHGFAAPLLDPLKSRNAAGQIIRSSSAMAQNYAATCLARSHKEFTAKMGVVAEESQETLKWLQYLVATGLVQAGAAESLIQEASELTAISRASWRTAERNAAKKQNSDRKQSRDDSSDRRKTIGPSDNPDNPDNPANQLGNQSGNPPVRQ